MDLAGSDEAVSGPFKYFHLGSLAYATAWFSSLFSDRTGFSKYPMRIIQVHRERRCVRFGQVEFYGWFSCDVCLEECLLERAG